MAGTDPYKETGKAPDLMWRKAVARLRSLLKVNPKEAHLITHKDEQRWLSDRYVMVNVTGDLALSPEAFNGAPFSGEMPDGTYHLTAAKGLVPHEFLPSDTGKLIDALESREGWRRVHRTQWSVADSKAKLMLVYAQAGNGTMIGGPLKRVPMAINEGIWTAFEQAFWDELVTFETLLDGYPFRVSAGNRVVGYIARGELPADQIGPAAHLLAGMTPETALPASWWEANIYGTEAGE